MQTNSEIVTVRPIGKVQGKPLYQIYLSKRESENKLITKFFTASSNGELRQNVRKFRQMCILRGARLGANYYGQ